MEEEAIRLMKCYQEGNMGELQKYFESINKEEIKNIFDNTKIMADLAFRRCDYNTAIEMYEQCIAALNVQIRHNNSDDNKVKMHASCIKSKEEDEKKKKIKYFI